MQINAINKMQNKFILFWPENESCYFYTIIKGKETLFQNNLNSLLGILQSHLIKREVKIKWSQGRSME